ncbi:MAG: ParB/RepB/Spo0J family partition protein [Thermoanaerobaculia bacterium]
MSEANPQVLRHLPIEVIQRSPHNRKINISDPELLELAESIREHGVLQPILVQRLANDGVDVGCSFQIVAGERRFLASRLAGAQTIPALVFDAMPDVDAYQLTLIENLQRQNLTPLEEAEEYQKLLAGKWTVQQIASKIGKSARYVYDRSRLLSLTGEAQELLRSGKMDAGHAVELARLKPADQERAIEDGLFQDEQLEIIHREESFEVENSDPHYGLKSRTVVELRAWINRHVRLEAEPDPMLFPETAANLARAKEEAAKVVSIAYDFHVVPEAKDGTRIFGPQSWTRADGEEGSKTCALSAIGVVVAGFGRGQSFLVCTNKQKCLVHWGKEIRARQAREKGVATSKGTGEARANKAQEEYEAKRKREDDERQRFVRARPKILAALAAKVKAAPVTTSSFIGSALLDHCAVKPATIALVAPGKSSDDLLRALAFGRIYAELDYVWQITARAPRLGMALGVDVKEIVRQNEAELTAAAAAKSGAKSAPAAKGKKSTSAKKKAKGKR